MKPGEQPVIETKINDCLVTLSFVEKPADGVIENVQSILSNAYDERVQNDLMELARP